MLAGLRSSCAIGLIGAVAGCQFVSGLDDLEVGEGGASSQTTTTSTGTSTGMATGTTGTTMGLCPQPKGGPCLDVPCKGACAGDLCQVCGDGDASCAVDLGKLRCAFNNIENFDCEFLCGQGRCQDKTIHCPADADCIVRCALPGACAGTTIECGTGLCQVHCAMGGCAGSQLLCGAGKCEVICPDMMEAPPALLDMPACAPMNGCLQQG